MQSSHLQVISSLSEGLGLCAVEGLFYSPIILSTAVGGVVEILDKNYLKKIEEFSFEIEKIKDNYSFYENDFRQKHINSKKRFNLDTFINKLDEYYKFNLRQKYKNDKKLT